MTEEIAVNMGIDHWIRVSKHIPITVEDLESRIKELQDWCFVNLLEGSWHFEDFVEITDSNDRKMVFAKTVVFKNKLDATAFKVIFKL